MTPTQRYKAALLEIALNKRCSFQELQQIARAALGERALEKGREELEEEQARARRQSAPVERKGG